MTRTSLETPGHSNYSRKLNFRRDLDVEMRSEGHDYFVPNLNIPIGGQPFPGQRDVDSITRSGNVATVTIGRGHHYENGETLVIDGAEEPEYNGDFIISNVTATTFDYVVEGEPSSPAEGEITASPIERIILWHTARRPNGKTAVIAGSERRLYRYFALDNGAYMSTDPNDYPAGQVALYWSTNPADYPVGEIPEYVDSDLGEWIVIGWGFKTWAEGALRWEAVSINGWSVFNNSIDLAVSYRVEDIFVKPVYELREQGVAFFGTMAESSTVLAAADISEIFSTKMEELFAFKGTVKSGNLIASQTGNTVTASANFFDVSMVGKTIIYDDGTQRNITAFVNAKTLTVDGAATVISPGQKFTLRTQAEQLGSFFSGMTTGTLPQGSSTVTASAGIFTAGMVGKTLRFTNGFSRLIVAFISPTQVTLDTPAAPSAITNYPFFVVSEPDFASPDYIVTADSGFFTPDMVGLHLIWDSGETRTIKAFISSTQVYVDADSSISKGFIGLENTDTYAAYEQTQYTNRVQYRKIWSLPDLPTRWGAIVPGAIVAGQRRLQLKYPVKSFSNGQAIIITGAGVDGGNLITTVAYISALGSVMTLNDSAVTTVTDAAVTSLDTIGSILGFTDLQDDSSGIVKMLDLQGTLVVYKDTAIFLCTFTGLPDTPWNYRHIKTPLAKNLYYRFTLTNVQSLAHVYAGRNSFFRFDLTTRTPTEVPILEVISNIFYERATLARTNEIWAADNPITNSVFFSIPHEATDEGSAGPEGTEQVISWDYQFNTTSTLDISITGAGAVKRPETGIAVGETEDWFAMGTQRGVALIFGRTEEPQPFWANSKEIYYRRESNPFDPTPYPYVSRLHGGMAHFGTPFNEKDLLELVIYLASQSPNTEFTVELYGARNTPESPTLLATRVFSNPISKNLMPIFFRENYYMDNVIVFGLNNPLRIAMRTWRGHGLDTRSIIRRP